MSAVPSAIRRSIFRSTEFLTLVVGALLLALLGPVAILLSTHLPFEESLLEREFAGMEDVVGRLEVGPADLASPDAAAWDERARLLGLRVTLIGEDQRVVYDSEPGKEVSSARGDEVSLARSEGLGRDRRALSRDVADEWLFVAKRVDSDPEIAGFVRVARPLGDVFEPQRILSNALAVGVFVAFLAALAGIIWGTWQWWSPLRSLTGFARALARSHEDAAAPEHVGSFGRLGRALVALDAQAKRRIEELSRDDAQLRAILTSMVEGILAVDEADRVVFANDAARTLLGMEGRVVGQSLWSGAPIVELEELIDAARAKDRPQRREMISLRTGNERVFAMHASPFASGEDRGVVVIAQDLTELRRLERIRRDFVANVSHELKTPLTSISGYVDTILEGDVDPERMQRFLGRVQANVTRLKALVGDLLSLARIEAGDEQRELVPIDWASIVDAVTDRQEDAAQARSLELCREGESSLRVLGDREAMTQILENLLDNAIKYTREGTRVTVSLERHADVGRLVVEDTGDGIPDEDQERIFERFYRVDKAHSLAVGGTGLGLSIVKNLTLTMNGEVRVKSALGQGARFEVDLTLAL